jgi:hypothetical protein
MGHLHPATPVLSESISTLSMPKSILKMWLNQPFYLGLCPKPRFGGNSKGWRLCLASYTRKTNPNL